MAWYHRAKPGDRIVCIVEPTVCYYSAIESTTTISPLTKGYIYTISFIHPPALFLYADVPLFNLLEILPNDFFPATLFKPLEKRSTDISIFTKLLNTKQKELEDA